MGRENKEDWTAFCAICEERVLMIEKDLRKLPAINTKLNVGVGIILCGSLLVGIMFSTINTFKVEAKEVQGKHELVVDQEQSALKKDIGQLKSDVGDLSTNVAVLQLELSSLKEDLKHDREETKEVLKELREYLRSI